MQENVSTIQTNPERRRVCHQHQRQTEVSDLTRRPPSRQRRESLQYGTRRARTKPDVAHTRSISNAANNQAVSWTTGSKPNENSNPRCFRARRQARKRVRNTTDVDQDCASI